MVRVTKKKLLKNFKKNKRKKAGETEKTGKKKQTSQKKLRDGTNEKKN